MQLLGYSAWLLGCCYAVARVTGVVARVLIGYPAVAKVSLCGC